MSLSLLEEYIESGDSFAMDNLLHNNPSLAKQETSHGISPILLACYYNKLAIIKVLLKHIDKVDIYEAAAVGLLNEAAEIIEINPSVLSSYSNHGFTALGMACHFGNEEIVRHLLLKGADPNQTSNNGYNVNPLYTAVSSNFEAIAKLLVEGGAEVNIIQAGNLTPLHAAASNGNIEMLILLLENGADVLIKDDNGQTPAHSAQAKGHHEIAKILS
jgi:ankyrin repeat protein